MSVGCTVDGRHPKEVTSDIKDGTLVVPTVSTAFKPGLVFVHNRFTPSITLTKTD